MTAKQESKILVLIDEYINLAAGTKSPVLSVLLEIKGRTEKIINDSDKQ